MVVFSFENGSKKRIFVISNIVSSMSKEAFIDCIQIPDTQPPIFLGLANVLPRAKSNRRGRVVILNCRPPKPSNDGIDFFQQRSQRK